MIEVNEKYIRDMRILFLKHQLKQTDYIANKLTEVIAEYLVTNDIAPVVALKTKYAEQLQKRQLWRDEINLLERQI